jgi:hypothetical protein
LLPASWSLQQATVIAQVLESTVKKSGEDNSEGLDCGPEANGDDDSKGKYLGGQIYT